MEADSYVQYKAMVICTGMHLLLLMFELLACDKLESNRRQVGAGSCNIYFLKAFISLKAHSDWSTPTPRLTCMMSLPVWSHVLSRRSLVSGSFQVPGPMSFWWGRVSSEVKGILEGVGYRGGGGEVRGVGSDTSLLAYLDLLQREKY